MRGCASRGGSTSVFVACARRRSPRSDRSSTSARGRRAARPWSRRRGSAARCQRDGLRREQGRGEDRQRAVLVPGCAHAPFRGRPPSITKDSATFSATMCSRRRLDSSPVDVTRERAWQTLTEYTQSEALGRHALAVEASVGAYARKLGRTRSSGARRRCCTTSTTRSTPRSTSIRRTARRSSASRATPRS